VIIVSNRDCTTQLRERVAAACSSGQPLNIRGSGSKNFLGTTVEAESLDVTAHSGIISYEPSELVITARSGTTLSAINEQLAAGQQMIPFEPPCFGPEATLGGTVACALSGPARPYLGGTRDFALGCTLLNGRGQVLKFGGQVMKNVAGYDVTRLMAGAMGTLGVLLDFSMKVLPKPEHELTVMIEATLESAIDQMHALAGSPIPVTASAWHDNKIYIRLAGPEDAVSTAAKTLSSDFHNNDFWVSLREHQLNFFTAPDPLWRISVPPLTPPLPLKGKCLYDWAGMQRWLFTDESPDTIRQAATTAGGHAQLYRADEHLKSDAGVFHPPDNATMQLHVNLKNQFDPQGLFNRQRLFANF